MISIHTISFRCPALFGYNYGERLWVMDPRMIRSPAEYYDDALQTSSITYDATVLQGHQNYVSAVAAHAPTDGIPLIYTGSNDNSIRAYSLGHSQPDFTLIGHTDTVCALTVDPNGILVSGSWDKSVKVWRDRNCVGTIQGHQAAVWTVLLMPYSCIPDASETDIVILAGSADHCIYVWLLRDVHHKQSSEQKSLSASLVSTLKGHSDCVRCIARVDSHRVLSSSNDASILAWDISTGQCIGEFYGHAHYVYAVATRPSLPIFVSSGEDRSVRVWPMPASEEWIPRRQFSSLQSIPLPCQSAWCVDLTVLGDIVVGGSDSVIRLFSSDPVRQAPPDAIQTYEAELASSKIAATDACGTGDLDVSKLPGPEALLQPGKKEGQVLVIRDSDRSVCYQWSANEFRWIELGDVVGAGNSKLPVHNGKEYDFVFSVDVSDNGQALKLPYNRTEDPWLVAQRFIHEHDLPQDYLDTVAQFIIKNAGPQFNPAPAACSDPFTGADRYIPGGTNGSTFAVGKLAFEDYFPSKEFICLKTIALDPLLSKLELFNKQENEASIEVEHMNLIRSFSFDMPEEDAVRLTEAALTALSRWPLVYALTMSVKLPNTRLDEERFPISLSAVQSDLLRTYFDCQIRGLIQSCKWLGDLMCAISGIENGAAFNFTSGDNLAQLPLLSIPTEHLSTFLFARSLYDAREYDYCAQVLLPCLEPPVCSVAGEKNADTRHPILYFMYIYARYMACEKRRANDEVELRRICEQDGNGKPAQAARAKCARELSALRCEIETIVNPENLNSPDPNFLKAVDPFVIYLFALIYRRLTMEATAVALLVRAININPCMWPAWYELSQLIKDREHLNGLKLPSQSAWMYYFFEAKVLLKLNESERALSILHRLSNSGFSKSDNLQAEIALAYDGLRDIELAAKQFHQLFESSPCRLDNVDTYSNVLFVKEDSVELAHLAHHCVDLDKYRPETCCVVGNFFGLRGLHDKAVLYFRRALKLKPSYSLVWTLVGHEYTELRNTNAAVHAYRQAIAHNRHDFRAWYGLGQMYEILDLPSFALYYYREAQYLAPTDSRLIVALGEIYERLNRLDEAKRCYWRAHCVGDIEGSALVRLAQCFIQCGEAAEAAAAYTVFIKMCHFNGVQSQSDLAQAYKYLATYHLQMGHYEDSAAAACKCSEFPETREEAKAMFRQITAFAGDVELITTDQSSDDPPSCDNATDELAAEDVGAIGTDLATNRVDDHNTTCLEEVARIRSSNNVQSASELLSGVDHGDTFDIAPPSHDESIGLSLGNLLAVVGLNSSRENRVHSTEVASALSTASSSTALSPWRDVELPNDSEPHPIQREVHSL
ncbi:unnamed protein product [Dicrocoelium dendriticum]|nr:unnamed protein product [Dicrocoelium dendriticum]